MKQIDELIEHLRGTCQTLDEACRACGLPGEDALTQGELEYIDEHIFCCACCGWWDDAGEQDEEQNCPECSESK